MEHSHNPSLSPEHSSDASEKKDTKKSKKHVSHVPIPIAAMQAEENRRYIENQSEKADKSKRKRRHKKRSADTAPVTASDVTETKTEDTTEESTVSKTTEAEKAPEHEIDSAKQSEYQGELLISERARRQKQPKTEASPAKETSTELEPTSVETTSTTTESETAPDDTDTTPEIEEPSVESTEEVEPDEDETEDTPTTTATSSDSTSSRPTASRMTTSPIPPVSPVPPIAPHPSAGAPPRGTSSGFGAGTPPPVPPPFMPGAYGYPPVPSFNAAPVLPNTAPSVAVPEVVTVPDRRAERRNLLTGLVVGGVIEHIRHKRREKRREAEYAKDTKHRTAAAEEKLAHAEAAHTRQKTDLEQRIERLQRSVVAKTEQSEKTLMVRPETELVAPIESQTTETHKRLTEEEQKVHEARKKLEQALAIENNEEEAEKAEVPKDRRVETSAWHRIEVDKRTGRAVEDPTIAYGKEFENEQHQEMLRREIEAASMASEALKQKYSASTKAADASNEVPGADFPSLSKKPAKKKLSPPSPERASQLVDMVLWGVLGLVIVAIVLALTA